jgi:hypothetical protein
VVIPSPVWAEWPPDPAVQAMADEVAGSVFCAYIIDSDAAHVRLAAPGQESFGFVLAIPADELKDWVFGPLDDNEDDEETDVENGVCTRPPTPGPVA